MNEEHGVDGVRHWLLSLGFPLDEAAHTDWSTLCCGRLPTFWRKMMAFVKSKHDIDNIRRNVLLKEIHQYKQRQNSSATKLGFLLPPLQIYYPKERQKLNRNLDAIQSALMNKKNECKIANEERKRKCLELREAKRDTLAIERQIYLMKKTREKLNGDVQRYKEMSTRLDKFKDSFSVKELDDQIENQNFRKFISAVSNVDTPIALNGNFVEKVQTFHLNNLILNYHRNLPDIVEEHIFESLQEKFDKIKSSVNDGECTAYKKSLLRFDTVHAQIVIKTLQIKKDVENANIAASRIKSKILDKLSADSQKMEFYEQQCSQMRSVAYKELFFEELKQLKALSGFYSKCHNDLHTNKIGDHENSPNAVQAEKEKYLHVHLLCKDKIKTIFCLLEEMKLSNNKISTDITEIVTNKRPDKVLWYPNNKELQEIYTKVILKNPNTFKLENGHSFESLTYLQSIIAEYNLDYQLQESALLFIREIKWFKSYSDRIEKEDTDDKKINILLNYNLIVKKMKFKMLLDDLNSYKRDSQTVKNTIGSCLESNLSKREEMMLYNAEKQIPKNVSFADLNQIFVDFNDTHDFFVEYSKCKDIPNETVR